MGRRSERAAGADADDDGSQRKESGGKAARRAAKAERRQEEKANLARVSGDIGDRTGPTIFCDLDGVLADFDLGYHALFGEMPDTVEVNAMWANCAATPDYFTNLPWKEGGRALFELIRPFNPVILTGCPRGGWAAPQKVAWCNRELGPEIRVITCQSRAKSRYCIQGDVLIDDRYTARKAWVKAKGEFVHHVMPEESLAQVQGLISRLGLSAD